MNRKLWILSKFSAHKPEGGLQTQGLVVRVFKGRYFDPGTTHREFIFRSPSIIRNLIRFTAIQTGEQPGQLLRTLFGEHSDVIKFYPKGTGRKEQ
jgi:hypothetical protein